MARNAFSASDAKQLTFQQVVKLGLAQKDDAQRDSDDEEWEDE
jgi:hypothetical protein